MSNPKIKRYRRRERFTTIDNAPLENKDLSWRAKGILTYLIGKPENWEVRLTDLIKKSTEGRDAVRSALRELKDAGYLATVPDRDMFGKIIDNVTYVSDRPDDLTELLETRRPEEAEGRESRQSDKPDAGKSAPINKEDNNKETPLTKLDRKIVEYCGEVDLEKKTLLKNSVVSPFKTFARFFDPDKYLGVDIEHYYDVFIEWNERKRTARTGAGWIISIRNAIARDAKKGIVKRDARGQQASADEMTDFLKLGRQ